MLLSCQKAASVLHLFKVNKLYLIAFDMLMQLDPSIYESLQKERVEVGDVIYIEANSGAVKVWTDLLNHSLSGPYLRLAC